MIRSCVQWHCRHRTEGEDPGPTAGHDARKTPMPRALLMMARATKFDPLVVCTTEESGEHVIAGCGEPRVEICLKDLRDFICGDPVVSDRETSYTATNGTCKTSSCTVGLAQRRVTGYKDVSTDKEQVLMLAVTQQSVSTAIEAEQSLRQSHPSGVLTASCGTKFDRGVLAGGYGTDTCTCSPLRITIDDPHIVVWCDG